MVRFAFVTLGLLTTLCCGGEGGAPESSGGNLPRDPSPVEFAIAIHGGAGSIPRTIPDDRREAYRVGLESALRAGTQILERNGTALDAVERVIVLLEDNPLFNAGKGAVFNHRGEHELDASIMDGASLSCGAVAGVRSVKNPIRLARLVMEHTGHVLLGGAGADQFGIEQGLERVEQEYYFTPRRHEAWQGVRERERENIEHGTVGAVALDRHGNLAAGTSTGGLTNKRYGRIGDSPIVGAGTYADNGTCAISGTGKGEEYIRHSVAHSISALMAYRGLALRDAAEEVVLNILAPGDGGIIGVDRKGRIAMVFNTDTMCRGAADSSGRFEVKIWD